jgi:hypothetical protein
MPTQHRFLNHISFAHLYGFSYWEAIPCLEEYLTFKLCARLIRKIWIDDKLDWIMVLKCTNGSFRSLRILAWVAQIWSSQLQGLTLQATEAPNSQSRACWIVLWPDALAQLVATHCIMKAWCTHPSLRLGIFSHLARIFRSGIQFTVNVPPHMVTIMAPFKTKDWRPKSLVSL